VLIGQKAEGTRKENSMEQEIRGMCNFLQNIKPIMEKCRDGKKLSKDEQGQIVKFYLEVAHFTAYVSNDPLAILVAGAG
jgi:hypothetical protein